MYVKLFDDLLDSTIWMEKDHIVRVWLTLLLLSNSEGFVEMPIPALASRARVGLDECAEAIARLEAPDPYSRTGIEEGRRIIKITDEKTLWKIVNFEYYRALRSAEQKREYQKRYMREYRERKKKDLLREDSGEKSSQGETKSHGLAQAEAEAEADIKKTTSSSSSRKDDGEFVERVLAFWNSEGLRPAVRGLSPQRRTTLLARKREHSEEKVMEALENRANSRFLCFEIFNGKGAPFDWVFGPKNFVKVLDGNFNDVPGGTGKGGKSGKGKSEYDAVL